MANIKSAKKRVLVTATKTARNKAIKSEVKTYIKKVDAAVEAEDKDAALAALKEATSVIARACSKGVYHKNTARFLVSARLSTSSLNQSDEKRRQIHRCRRNEG